MWELETRLLSIFTPDDINIDSVCKVTDILDHLQSDPAIGSKFAVCNDIWFVNSDEARFILDEVVDQDLKMQLSDILFKNTVADMNTAQTVIAVNNKRIDESIVASSFIHDESRVSEQLLIKSVSDFNSARKDLIKNVSSYDEFAEKACFAYTNLVFHPETFNMIHKLGKFNIVKDELFRHLDVLNDYAKEIYIKLNRDENAALTYINSAFNITCSGKGSCEGEFKIDYYDERLTCNSHTKFYHGGNDQRIYFTWGRENLCNDRLIICKIGSHWVG